MRPIGVSRARARWFMVLVPVLNACETTGPALPAGAESFTPHAVYADWWALTEECSGLRGNLAGVEWYRVPGAEEFPLNGTSVSGRWDAYHNRIIIAGPSEFRGDVVRHEMLHSLLHEPGHSREAFLGRCAGVVVCTRACATGPAPTADPSAQLVKPSQLELGVQITPESPSSSARDGTFMMIITARNPYPRPVLADLPIGNTGSGASFSFRIVGGAGWTSYDMQAVAPEVRRFAASETKRFIFDFHIGEGITRYDQPPGTYQFNGGYGGAWAPNPPTIVVAP